MTKTAPSRAEAPSLAAYAWRCLFSPSQAAETARRPGSLTPAVQLYAAFLLATAALFAWKPYDFPDPNAALPLETQNFQFWLKVMLWQPLLEAAWIAFLLAMIQWLREGKLAARFVGGVLLTALPIVLVVLYLYSGLPKPVFGLLIAAWLGTMAWFVYLSPRDLWRPVASLMLALNAIGLALVLPMALSIGLGAPQLFTASQVAGGLWILGCGTLALRALTGMRLPRCFMATLLSMFMQIAFALSLFVVGIVSKNILKALLYM